MKISESEVILIVVLVLIGFVLYTQTTGEAMKTTSVKTVGGKHTVSEDIDKSCTGNNFGSVECAGVNQISCNHTNDCKNKLNTQNVICESHYCEPMIRECNNDDDCAAVHNCIDATEINKTILNLLNFEKVCSWSGG